MARPIVLVHGAWLNSASWAPWKTRFEAQGYSVITPDWPYDDRPPAELRASPHPLLKTVGPKAIVDSFETEIRKLAEPPILIGHSAGAVWVQHLLDRGLGAAGVSINPAPTPGVPLGPHAIVSALPVLGDPFSGGKAVQMTRKFFATRFAQTLPAAESGPAYDAYIVPTAGKVYWDGVFGGAGAIDWASKTRAPLLLIAGGKDLIADASMTRAIYERQKKAASLTEFKLYPERSHWTCLDKGWEDVADFALDWALRNAR